MALIMINLIGTGILLNKMNIFSIKNFKQEAEMDREKDEEEEEEEPTQKSFSYNIDKRLWI